MLAEVQNGDYHVRLTTEEIEFLTRQQPHPLGYSDWVWPQFNVDVHASPASEQLNIGCTVDSVILRRNEKNHDNIYFDRDGDGTIVRVHPAELHDLVEGKDYLVTRYDGHSDKIWIERDDDQPQQLELGLPGIKSYPHIIFAMREKYVSRSEIYHLHDSEDPNS